MFYIPWEELHLFPVEHLQVSHCVSHCYPDYFYLQSCQVVLYFKTGVWLWRLANTFRDSSIFRNTVYEVYFPVYKFMRYCE